MIKPIKNTAKVTTAKLLVGVEFLKYPQQIKQ